MSHRFTHASHRPLRLAIEGLVCVAFPLMVALGFLQDAYHQGILGIDLEQTLLPAARVVADGGSPYPAYGYPPLVAFVLVPLTVVPGPNIVFTALLAMCIPASLWLFGVRDWRCYGIVFAWPPVLSALQTCNVTLLLLLGSAMCWRWRDRWAAAAVSGGLAFAAKILCWPLALWLAASRRLAAAAGVVVVAGGVTLVLWASLGFSGLTGYPSSLQKLDKAVSSGSYTLEILLGDLGVPAGLSQAVWALVALGTLAAVVVLARRGDEPRSFALCMASMILASPIVWMHSFALLAGTIAVTRPRLSAAWLLPLLFVVGSGNGNGTDLQTAAVLAVAGLTICAALTSSSGLASVRPLDRSAAR